MQKTRVLICIALCAAVLCGCMNAGITEKTKDPTQAEASAVSETTQPPAQSETTAPEETKAAFLEYSITVSCSKLAVYSGPGYRYEVIRYIYDRGSYTIVEETIEKLDMGSATIWGKLSGEGWINLEDAMTEDKSQEMEEENEEAFEPYVFSINNPCLQIYSGPGYHYERCGEIEDRGSYTIMEESVQYFPEGRFVTWGRLKSGAGWICLDDALLNPQGGPPYRCTSCGRADVDISRRALCDACDDTFEPYILAIKNPCLQIYSGPGYHYERCGEIRDRGSYTIMEESVQYFSQGGFVTWGRLKSGAGWICLDDARSDSCHDEEQTAWFGFCSRCGVAINEENYMIESFGLCVDCYYATLDPAYICDNCGKDGSFVGMIDGLCEPCYAQAHHRDDAYCAGCGRGGIELDENGLCHACANGVCHWCGGPLGDEHNCDDYPNVVCPNCGWGMFTTGVGTEGIVCPECGTRVV